VSADTRGATPVKLPGIIVVHENRGLNPHIGGRRAPVRSRQLHGVCARRTHLPWGLSRRRLQRRPDVQQGRWQEDDRRYGASAMWLKARADCNRQDRPSTGFCYGGGISNILASRLGGIWQPRHRTTAPFPQTKKIPKIKAAVLVHHGNSTRDWQRLGRAYDAALKSANVTHEGFIYPGRRSWL